MLYLTVQLTLGHCCPRGRTKACDLRMRMISWSQVENVKTAIEPQW